MYTSKFSITLEPSAYNVKTLAYAVHPYAESSEVLSIQIANKSNDSHNVDVFWVEYALKEVDYIEEHGDGDVLQTYYNYPPKSIHTIIQNAIIPKGSSLNVLSTSFYLKAKDFIYVRPSSVGSDTVFTPTVTVDESFPAGMVISDPVNLTDVTNEILAKTY